MRKLPLDWLWEVCVGCRLRFFRLANWAEGKDPSRCWECQLVIYGLVSDE